LSLPQINKHQLFNLKQDPDEMHDVAAKFPQQVNRLKLLMKQQQVANGDKQDLAVENPKPARFEVPQMKAALRHKTGGEAKKQTAD